MDQEQLDLIIRAAQALQDKKETYDYMIIVLPVLTGLAGWLASIWWQSRTFSRNTRKEHYYVAKEKAEEITSLFNEFLEYVYSFYKQAKNNANLHHQGVDDETLSDFITEYQFKLGFIYQKLKITFPGKRFPIEKVTRQMKSLEDNIIDMNDIMLSLHNPAPDMDTINDRIADLNNKNNQVITNITDEVSRIDNAVIETLNNRAKELGIKDF